MAHPHQPPVPTSVLDGAVEDYPSDWKYWKVGIILFVLTAIEVSTYVLADSVFSDSRVLIATLVVLMVIKFWAVAWYFMHLKFDKRILTVAFYSGIALALVVYLCMLLAFRYFGDDGMICPSDSLNCITEG